MMTTLYRYTASYTDILPNHQGRSKKKLRPVIEFDGHVFIAGWEGRQGRFFGATEKEALNNLQVGGQ